MTEEIYKGYRIEFNEGKDEWQAKQEAGSRGEVDFRDPSLKNLKAKIDKQAKKAFKRIPAFADGRWGTDMQEAEVTSIIEEKGSYGSISHQAWVTYKKDKGREKLHLCNIYPDNEHNRPLGETILRKMKERERLKEDIKVIKERMKCLVIKEAKL